MAVEQEPSTEPEVAAAAFAASQGADAPRISLLSRAMASKRYVLPLVCLFQFSLLVSWYTVQRQREVAPAEQDVSVAEKDRPQEGPAKTPVSEAINEDLSDLRIGAARLREGDFASALPYFLPGEAETASTSSESNRFCAALCLEGLGRWKEALATYRELTAKTNNARMKTAGQVAQARIWVRRNQTAETKALLYPLILQAGQPGRYNAAVVAEARYLLGIALSREAFDEQRIAMVDEVAVRANPASLPIVQSLDWVEPASEDKEPIKELPSAVEVFQQYGDKPEEVLVRGTSGETAAVGLVEKVAGLGKLQVHWSIAAWQRIEDRKAQVAIDNAPLLDVVHALLAPHGLVCQLKDGALQVATDEETAKDVTAAFQIDAARQALRAAVFADPGHPLAATAYLELGNDEAALGKLDEAVAWYERLIAEAGRSPQVFAAYFNLGLVQRGRMDFVAARKSFYRLVDRSPGHELTPRAFVQIGWTFLMVEQPLEAIFPLNQALAAAPAPPARPEALIALSAAYLLNGNPREANAVLAMGRSQLNQDPWGTPAAFLDALARFRVAAAAKLGRTEAADLLAALLAYQNVPSLGLVGHLLVGQAYKELGMPQQMTKVYENALTTAGGPVAEEMTYGLADQLYAEGKVESAKKLLHSLAGLEQGKWTCAARLRLAAIALQEGRAQECVSACAALLPAGATVDRKAVLQLMAAAYEQLGDYQKAASCYGGQVPD